MDEPGMDREKQGMNRMKVQYESMLPGEIREARERKPVAYLPMGILEWHGEFLPVGNDALKAHALGCRMAEKIGGLVMPAFYWADNRSRIAEVVFKPEHFSHLDRDHTTKMMEVYGLDSSAFALEADRSTKEGGWWLFEEVLDHSLHQIESLGFEVIVTISGHYPLIGPANRVAEAYDGKSRIMSIIGYDLVQDEGYSGDHAAKWETSLLMALRPELVDFEGLKKATELTGIMGEDPREASVEYGEEAIDAIIRRAEEKIDTLLGE
jgi:creatinine amidohydrolase